MKTETYIANGKHFASFEAVAEYADANGWRIANTETLRKGVYLVTLNSK
jgi:hypothetical protein